MTEIIFITSLIVLFFHVSTWEGMIFSFIGRFFKNAPDYLKKPLFSCPICMCIWWAPSIVSCGIVGNVWQVNNVWQLSIIITAAAGINTLFTYLISLAKSFIKEDCCSGKHKPSREEKKARRKRLYNIHLQNFAS